MRETESKYKLVIRYVTDGIRSGNLKKGDWIPSINEFRTHFGLSRDTVFAGLRELKSLGIIDSTPGVGYYVASENIPSRHNIFLLFNELNEFKEDLYNSFIANISPEVTVDLYFHNYNRHVFDTLISEANHKYTDYIIMSGKFEGVEPALNKLSGRVFLLDHFHPELKGKFSAVFQNFEKDTCQGLTQGIEYLKKYRHFIMVQKHQKEPTERYDGLVSFCNTHGFTCEYTGDIDNREINRGEVYMVTNDRNLVKLLKRATVQDFTPGRDFGIISYNDTPLKEILAGGITTLSTDFTLMGRTMASLIDSKKIETIENPFNLNLRKSL